MYLRNRARAPSAAPIIRTFRAGAQIFSEGDEITGGYRVLAGAVRSCRYLGDGRRQVLGFHLIDDIFGLELGAKHSASAEAMVATAVVSVSTRSTAGPGEYVDLLELATKQLQQAQDLTTDLGKKLAHERLANFLLDVARRLQSTSFRMPMRRLDIADHLGLTIESVSRLLNGFERAGLVRIIDRKKRLELLDLPRLCDLADGRPTALRFDS